MKRYASYKPSGVPWLGDVPSHWASKRLKHIGQFRAGAGFPIEEQGQPDNPLPFFKVKDIDGSNQGGVITTADSTVSIETANRLGAKIFPKNSIVFAKVGAALLLNRFRLLGVDACVDNNMMGYMINADEAFPEFMYWAMQRINFSEIVNPGTVPSLNEPLISNLFMAIPPPDEQQAIADYLDAETTRIDTLIHEKDELIGLLKEWRQSMIAEVVTKGLDKTVPMKPSGVPWLGDVPVHWAGKRLRDCVEGCSNGVWGDDPDGGDHDIPVIRVADFDRVGRQVVEYETIRKVDSGQRGSRALVPGDMLMEKSGGGEQQPVGMVVSYLGPEGAVCSNFVARMRSREGVVSRFMVYLHAYLYASQVTNISIKQTTGIQNLDSTAYLSESCFVPPPDEQQAIADYLDTETAKIDALIAHAEDDIVLLKELRSATIADAVLGRIDVRTH